MNGRVRWAIGGLLGLSALVPAGCNLNNLTEERNGNITVQFINNTSARAIYTLGSYEPLELNPPGVVTMVQQRLEANQTSTAATVPCVGTFAIGTDDLLQRIRVTNADNVANFDADAFTADVSFSNAPTGSDAAGLPTVGVARGREFLLGVDFKCSDQLIFTFTQDASAPGGFRIDFRVLSAPPEPN